MNIDKIPRTATADDIWDVIKDFFPECDVNPNGYRLEIGMGANKSYLIAKGVKMDARGQRPIVDVNGRYIEDTYSQRIDTNTRLGITMVNDMFMALQKKIDLPISTMHLSIQATVGEIVRMKTEMTPLLLGLTKPDSEAQ